jgi:3',5'-cyclic AMP phosphodiesterase CpdA
MEVMSIVPDVVVAHLSDTHFFPPGHPDAARTKDRLVRALDGIARREQPPAAIVVTGDLTQDGDPEAYRELAGVLIPAAAELGAALLCVPGNHDDRAAFSEVFGPERTADAVTQVVTVGGLRLVGLDSTVPGLHHGELDPAQLAELRRILTAPAPCGTLLALHHPPLPGVLDFIHPVMLTTRAPLAEVIAGSDVRGILAGHVHHPYFASWERTLVAVASSIGRPVDLTVPTSVVSDVDGPLLYNHIAVYPEVVTHAVIAVGDHPPLPNLRAEI